MADLADSIRNLAEKEGADFLGVADMTRAWEVVAQAKQPPAAGLRLPRAVSVGVRHREELVDGIPGTRAEYTKEMYGVIWPKARKLRDGIARLLKEAGCATNNGGGFGLPSGIPKMAGRLAGLGWIGKSSMLVTPQCGPRVIWEAVLTDAPLTPSAAKPMERRCGECRRCIEICPVEAYKDVPFKETDALAVRFNSGRCSAYRNKLGGGSTMRGGGGCGLCVACCPYGGTSSFLLTEPKEPGGPETKPAS